MKVKQAIPIVLIAWLPVAIALYIINQKHTITVYVDFPIVLERYQGAIEARAYLQSRRTFFQATIDSMQSAVREHDQYVLKHKAGLSKDQQEELDLEIQNRHQNVSNASAVFEDEYQSEDRKQSEAIYSQIVAFAELFSGRTGYDIILAKEAGRGILYAKTDLDVTEQFLIELNKHYAGED
jgi:Skp family chaperone for outer membrane proteins